MKNTVTNTKHSIYDCIKISISNLQPSIKRIYFLTSEKGVNNATIYHNISKNILSKMWSQNFIFVTNLDICVYVKNTNISIDIKQFLAITKPVCKEFVALKPTMTSLDWKREELECIFLVIGQYCCFLLRNISIVSLICCNSSNNQIKLIIKKKTQKWKRKQKYIKI